MRHSSLAWIASAIVALAACDNPGGASLDGGAGTGDAAAPPDAACIGLRCRQVVCPGGGTTSLSGTVFAPNGTLPLYNVNVYVPNHDPGPFTAGVTCDRCNQGLPGDPVTQTQTDEAGHFVLTNVPVVSDLPLIIQIGKWRKQILVHTVVSCDDAALPATATTLPGSYAEAGVGDVVSVDMPQIAITTGNADALECLVHKLGIADSEITNDAGSGHVHLYAGNGATSFAAGWAGGSGAAFSDATTLWGNLAQLEKYDIVMFSCEGGQNSATKPQTALQAVYDYANEGGRVFLSHWHNIWIEGNTQDAIPPTIAPPAPWPSIAMFSDGPNPAVTTTIATVDEAFEHGMSFAIWLMNVGASTVLDQIPLSDWRNTCASIDDTRAERWVYLDPATSGGAAGVQNFQFTTPNDVDPDLRCGKVAFSDMHVASGSSSAADTPYPGGCATTDLTPQEKALAFMFFDISSCVGVINKPAR